MNGVILFGGILATVLEQNAGSSWVVRGELGQVIDFAVNDKPKRLLCIMLGDLCTVELLLRHVEQGTMGRKIQGSNRVLILLGRGVDDKYKFTDT